VSRDACARITTPPRLSRESTSPQMFITHARQHGQTRRLALLFIIASVVACIAWPLRSLAQRSDVIDSTTPLTLERALELARETNAQLPVAALDSAIARSQLREARASRAPRLSLESSANLGGPLAYTTSQGMLQAVASDTLYSGGLRRANIRAAGYRVHAAGAGFRIAQKDVDLDVRLRFAELLKADEEVSIREQGIDRLSSYLAQIEARVVAGQPVGSDVLTTRVRLGTEQATLADAERARDEARLELNDLMGREPRMPLALVPLSTPSPTMPLDTAPWLATPELRQAEANSAIAAVGVEATRAERRPQLSMSAALGVIPTFSSSNPGTGPFSGSGFGGAVMFSLTWSLWDAGVFRTRLARANLLTRQAHGAETVARRRARLQWEVADAQRTRAYQQVLLWARNVPLSRDAYLQTASMYNGGAATALEVLDAFTAWVNASESYADAILRYRQAEANLVRWGTP
jgi:outer membrane protein TolC